MKPVSECTALVVDHNLFLPLAKRLARPGGFKRVLYHTPWEEGFPTVNKCVIGDGFSDIERCDHIFDVIKEVDCFVFPDILHSDLQLYLESQGCAVWGSRRGDSVEISRKKFHNILEEVGLTVPKFVTIEGMTKLKEHLKEKENVYIKISRFRGSLETTHWRSWDEDEGLLDVLSVRFGPAKEMIPFMVFDAIETDLEIGGDTYCIDGKFPSLMMHGLEWKDKGYLGALTEREKMPEQIQEVLNTFSKVLEGYRYRNLWSMELRVKDDESYFIDPCCRGPLPATGAQLEVYDNFADIIWHGANGVLLDPEPAAMFAAECILTMKGEKTAWGKTVVPDELKDLMKLSACCEIKGEICFPPDDSHGEEVGWLVATGDSIVETVETMLEQVKSLPDGVSANTASLIDLLKEAREAEKQDIEFSDDKVPSPLIAVEA